jgi:Ca-activated chloride channel family protein
VVDAELLPHLAGRAPGARLAAALAVCALAAVSAALAGPSWRSDAAPLYRDTSARIVVLDLSPSMDAVDEVPSRLERARAAIVAVLRESAGAQLGLVVFAADAFTVAPLMSDAGALVHLLASLDTATVPRTGARPDLGLAAALALLERSGARVADVILVGDSAGDERARQAAAALARAGYPLSVLAVGTPHGGPVRGANGAFLKDELGAVLVTHPELAGLERLARAGGGRCHLLAPEGGAPHFARTREAWAQAAEAAAGASDLRKDDGAWFALLALPFAALLFRRGWLLSIVLVPLLMPQPAYAFDWADLWRRADQQAAAAFAQGRFGGLDAILEKLVADAPWRAPLLYRDGRFDEAALAFSQGDDAQAHYNRGNALALAGRLAEALDAYGAALERSPSMRDALFNRALVREALAKRRATRGAAEAKAAREQPPARFSLRRERHAGGSGAAPDGAQREQRAAEGEQTQTSQGPSAVRQPEQGANAEQADGAKGAEARRLEALLAQVPDDPGSLLANRFRRQLNLRGAWHHDTGGRW